MGLSRTIVLSTVFLGAFYAAVSFPEITLKFYRVACNELPKLARVMAEIAVRVRSYCTTDLGNDFMRFVTFLNNTAMAINRVLEPIVKGFCYRIGDALVAIHNTAMSYTDDGLNQILGIEDSMLPQHVTASRHKLLSLILLVFWIVVGIVSISRMSYNKFFLLMSSTFLFHAIFGPVWCVRRLAFVVGLCMWIGSLIANKPTPAAVTILMLFLLTGLRKWRKRLANAKSAEDLVNFNRSMDQRMESLESKLDMVLAKVEFLVDKIPDRQDCRHA